MYLLSSSLFFVSEPILSKYGRNEKRAQQLFYAKGQKNSFLPELWKETVCLSCLYVSGPAF
jgi:hypothetical protein